MRPAIIPRQPRFFLVACLIEGSLFGVAALLAWLFRLPIQKQFYGNWADALAGVAAVVPLLALFGWMLRSRLAPLAEIRSFIEKVVLPVLGHWSLVKLALISLLAGVGEEALFRAVLQGSLSRFLGAAGALLVASLLFGLCHLVNGAYAILATGIGVYLGCLWLVTGNLIAPVTTHFLYDFFALVYLVRLHPRS